MPIVEIEIRAGRTADQKRNLAKFVTEGVVKALGVEPKQVIVVIRETAKENIWHGDEA